MRTAPAMLVCAMAALLSWVPWDAAGAHEPTLSRRLTGRTVWRAAQVHRLDAPTTLAANAELVIEPGAVIEAAPGASLIVPRDSRLLAAGTLLQPIVFRCRGGSTPGCWRGVVLDGFAPVNGGTATSPVARDGSAAGCRERIDGADRFGGCAPEDSSGVLTFVRVEDASEGLVLRGVGRRTVLSHLQVHRSAGSGVTVIGGTARLRRLVLTLNSQYGLRWRSGWVGDAQQVIVQQDPALSAGGLLGENGDDEAGADAEPRSAPVLEQVTIVAGSTAGNPYATSPRAALTLRHGSALRVANLLVVRAAVGLDVDGASSCRRLVAGELTVSNAVFAAVPSLGDFDADPAECQPVRVSPEAELGHLQRAGGVVLDLPLPSAPGTLLLSAEDLRIPDLRPRATASELVANAAPPLAGYAFDPLAFIGAVDPASATRSNIPWYSGWTIGGAATPVPPGSILVTVQSSLLGAVSGQRVRVWPLDLEGTTGLDGRFLFNAVPVGPHEVSMSSLPAGCVRPVLARTDVASAAVASVTIALDCEVVPDVALDAGAAFTCALDRLGGPWCWGAGGEGQLGQGTRDTSVAPVRSSGPAQFAAITAANASVCAVNADRELWCWGSNVQGQLALGPTVVRALVPTRVTTALRFTRVSMGAEHACGLTDLGAAYCWGSGNDGKLGTGAFTASSAPALVAGGLTWRSVAAGGAHSCGITTTGAAYCWGNNATGALGASGVAGTPIPVPVTTPDGVEFREVYTGESQTCAVTVTGERWCWGTNVVGQLGNGSTTNGLLPTLAAVTPTASVGLGAEPSFLGHVCGTEVTGTVRCWGLGQAGQLGVTPTTNCFFLQPWPCAVVPVVVPGLPLATRAVTGQRHSCALARDGTLWCWGDNASGQLGDGTRQSRTGPVRVSGSVAWPTGTVP